MKTYRLTCLICGHKERSLVAIQEHAMREHGYAQRDLQKNSRRAVEGYVYSMPDGVDWLLAEMLEGSAELPKVEEKAL
jgi:hypothetical protein